MAETTPQPGPRPALDPELAGPEVAAPETTTPRRPDSETPVEAPASSGPVAAPTPPATPVGPDGQAATPPRVAPWLVLYTLGRIAIAVALVLLLWLAGLGSYAGLLFGVLLHMPVSYLVLRPVRDRLTEALSARSVARRAAKENLRARLSGGEEDDA